MRLGLCTNGRSIEYSMQEAMETFLNRKGLIYKDEFTVKEVSRRADFLVFKKHSGLINIEAKCNDFKCMLKQLNDHAKYCDYCFAYITDVCNTPVWFKRKLAESGFGLIVYNCDSEEVTEVLEAHHNHKRDKELRNKILKEIKKQPLLKRNKFKHV